MYTAVTIPETNTLRRIWVYVPNNYAITQKRYPVLYLQDGQNLFDRRTSFSGEWEIDEFLDTISFAGIVIGIDNGGEKRITEYNPNDSSYGEGMGKEYLRRVVKRLKPYIDRQFRTITDAKHTAIAGSSMGGLISFYAGLLYPSVFGAVGVFSPSFWMVNDLPAQVKKKSSLFYKSQRYYFYSGGREAEHMVETISEISKLIRGKNAEVNCNILDQGIHAESSWRKMFPDFYRWLMIPLADRINPSRPL